MGSAVSTQYVSVTDDGWTDIVPTHMRHCGNKVSK